MANGSILADLKQKMDRGDTIPQNVANSLLLTGLIELYGKVNGIDKKFDGIEKSIDELKDCIERDAALEKSKEERIVTWPYLWENFGKTIVSLIIAIVISYFFFRAGIIK